MTQPFYLAIEGVIGVGKTTLARMLQPRLGGTLVLEAFDENPFLPKFYQDPERYAFQTQLFFLLSRYRQHQAIQTHLAQGHAVISDYIFAKDPLFAQLTLQGDELDMYRRVYEVLAERVPRPTLIVYLRASPDTLMYRIALRDRPYERNMPRSYIEALAQAYDELFTQPWDIPVLTIDTDPLDFVAVDGHLDLIEDQIRRALGLAPYQPLLPLGEDGDSRA
ncbi:MAG: deoxynucleoside kinase [Chloroflexi bacterium]|nr:deoxynucleoside kinase [Chloroflexota bacterium]